MSAASFDVMRDLLDHELLDSNDESCGMVDDVEIDFEAKHPAVTALLVGPGAWQARLPALLRVATRVIVGHERVRVPFAEVASVSEMIRLRCPATQLGLGVVDRRVGRWLKKVPGT
jgi:sporulation protein YlmC with PRC-barrel domain